MSDWTPRLGELVRYGAGVTALALHGSPHAGGWHGLQCMGGYIFYSRVYKATDEDRATWIDCAMRWRDKTREQAEVEAGMREAPISNFQLMIETPAGWHKVCEGTVPSDQVREAMAVLLRKDA